MFKKKFYFIIKVLIVVVLLLMPLYAQTSAQKNSVLYQKQTMPVAAGAADLQPMSSLASSTDLVKYLAKFFFYLLLIMAVYFWWMKASGLKSLSSKNKENLQVIQKLPLEPQVNLYVVKSGVDFMLLGVGGKNITLLKEYAKKDSELWSAAAAGEENSFLSILKEQADKLKVKKRKGWKAL
jgi:flagellar biogenesis protein FliO